jgi:hypothetical protein
MDEVLPKRMFVCDEVATQRVAADTFTGMVVYMPL